MTTHDPLMAITPATTMMLARYHDKILNAEEGNKWRRIAMILYAADEYTRGRLSDADMHALLNTAMYGRNEEVRKACKSMT